MVKHVILWQLKDELQGEERQSVLQGIKEGLEGLAGQIPGLEEIRVQIEKLPSSNADVMLDSCFTDAEALAGYTVHPAHVKVGAEKVKPFVKTRTCLDFEA